MSQLLLFPDATGAVNSSVTNKKDRRFYGSIVLKMLARLRKAPATNIELAEVAGDCLSYSARRSDLRSLLSETGEMLVCRKLRRRAYLYEIQPMPVEGQVA